MSSTGNLTQACPTKARFQLRPHPLLRDIALTAGAEFTVLVAGLLVISIFGRLFGAIELAEYLLLRRVLAWLQSGTQLGLGVALPRYVAHSVARPEMDRRSYLLVALVLTLFFTTSLGLVLSFSQNFFARLFFGNPEAAPLIPALALLMIGLGAHLAVYGYYRGVLAMGRANALQVWNLAIVPVIAVVSLRRTHSVALIVGAMGTVTLVTALLAAAPSLTKSLRSKPKSLRQSARQLLRYGVTRVAGDFGGSALFALAAIVPSHFIRIEIVASLLLGLSMLTAVSASAVPLGIVLLSKVTMMLAQDRIEEVRAGLTQFLAFALEFPVFAALQLIVFADVLVRAWVGPRFMADVPIIRIILAGIPFYVFFIALRSVIDAASVVAYNTRNVLTVLAVFLVMAGAIVGITPRASLLSPISGAMLGALVLLAYLTARTVRDLYKVRVLWSRSAMPLALAAILGAASYLFHWANGFRTSTLEICLVEAVMLTIFVGVLRKWNTSWVISTWILATRPASAGGSKQWLVKSLSSDLTT